MANRAPRAPNRDDSPPPALLARAASEREAAAAALAPARPQLSAAPQGLRDDGRLAGLGRALPEPLRAVEERRLGIDLSRVRLHDDHTAQAALDDRGARAMTRGSTVALRPADARADTPETAALVQHEIAHVAQQARPGAGAVTQHRDGEGQGIGRAPPEDHVVSMDGTGSEDDHVLFDTDSATLTAAARAALAAAATGQTGAVAVHIHGYASTEGNPTYNRNLSAHRAVAIHQALAALLPEGTTFTLYAHGEVDTFGDAGENRRAGVDFISAEEARFLTLPGLTVPSWRQRNPIHLIDPADLRLDLGPPPGTTPQVTLPPPLTPEQLGLPSLSGANALPGPRLPQLQPQPTLFAPPPPLFQDGYDFGSIAAEYGRRGAALPPRDAQSMTDHFDFWRLRFFQWGLSPSLATTAAQFGTDLAFSTQIGLDSPFAHESLDRKFGTEPPPTLTILNETRMIWIFNQVQGLFQKEPGK